jgi:multiple sugar transport system substrate-binding protein
MQPLKSLFVTAALAALLTALALGCRPPAAANVIRFRYWGDADEVGIIEGLVKDFEAANPGVEVRPERKDTDGYADALYVELASHRAPDVMFMSTDNIDILADSDQLADLAPWLARDPDLKASDYYDAMMQRFTKGSRLLVLPRDIAPVSCIYYNRDLFAQAGLMAPGDDWSWDELRLDALALTRRDKDGTARQLGFADDWNLVDAWMVAGGGRQLDDFSNPTRFTFAEDGALEGILFRYRLLQVDKAMPSSADSQAFSGGAMALFLNGNLGMFHSGLWKTPGFRNIKTFKWDVAPFPHKAGVQPQYWAGGSGYTMRSDVANPDLCWKLIKFMAGPIGQTRIAATGLAQPALRGLANSPVFLDGKDPQNKKMLLVCAEHAQASPAWKPWVEFVTTLWRPQTDPMWIQGYQGDTTALLKDLQAKANAKFFPAH